MEQIIPLSAANNDYGVYSTTRLGPFGTPLLFRGSFEECLEYRRNL